MKNRSNITRVVGANALKKKQAELESMGYIGLPSSIGDGDSKGPSVSWSDTISSQLNYSGDSNQQHQPSVLFASSGGVATVASCGTKGLGYINWGENNKLPNVIALLAGMLSYTAIGWKLNTDIVSGLGPQAMYHYAQYVAGNITEKNIPYETAGLLIKGMISDLQQKLANIDAENPPTTPFNTNNATKPTNAIEELKQSINEQIASLNDDYATWEATNKELQDFKSRNNLAMICLSLAGDQQMFGMCFPEVELNQKQLNANGEQVQTKMWTPKIVRLNYRPAHTCRLEQMDQNGKINNVYVSNQWFDDPMLVQGVDPFKIAAIPALSQFSALADLDDAILNARSSNVPVSQRPTRFIIPSYYPTVGRPYYTVPAWHSIFGDCIYEYAATMISDRFKRKRNSNVIGRIVYINTDYLGQCYMQKNCQTNEEKETVLKTVFDNINEYLKNRNNAGKSMLAFTFNGSDGKEHKSFEVVEIQVNQNDSAQANQKELQEISSIIFFAMGLDAKLVGNTPGNVSTGGGTDLRERLLIKQIVKSAEQKILLSPLDFISKFNKWDSHLIWQIQREVVTTLDNSKTGITKAE
jgi:hypothetical protein